ncbi:protein maelstrom homolog [Ornithodoros turicata]|uniref:protein maelstrom homolog n=1 Tax=Ornithodoros turicata TaxID=34597 RepID=UPI003139B3A1
MPKKRAAPKGPFYFLMLEVQDRRKKQFGHCTLEQAKDFAGVEWQEMSEERRRYYEEKAKQYKEQQKGNLYTKFTSDGRPIALVLKEEEDKIKMKEDMIRDIDQFVRDIGSVEEIKMFKFYIISFNILCEVHGEYLPLEIGAIEYTIQYGFTRAFHRFIDPGEIPLGFASCAKDHSEATHGIPITGFQEGDRNYGRLMKQLCDFLYAGGGQQLPPLFCTEDHLTQTDGCLSWLKGRSGFNVDFQIWDIMHLLLKLRRVAGKELSTTEAEGILNSAIFDYEVKSLCSYHADIDNKNCALGQCRRLGYKLSNALLNVYDIEHSIDYQHLPPRIDPTMNYEITHLNVKPSRGGRRPMSAGSTAYAASTFSRTVTPTLPNSSSTIVPVARSIHAEYQVEREVIPSAQSQVSSGRHAPHSIDYRTASEAVMGVECGNHSVPSLSGDEFPSLSDSMRSVSVNSTANCNPGSRGHYVPPPRNLGPRSQQHSLVSQVEESSADDQTVPEVGTPVTRSQPVKSSAKRIAAQFPTSIGSGHGLGRGHTVAQRPLAPVGPTGERGLVHTPPNRLQAERMVAEFLGRGLGRGSAF